MFEVRIEKESLQGLGPFRGLKMELLPPPGCSLYPKLGCDTSERWHFELGFRVQGLSTMVRTA